MKSMHTVYVDGYRAGIPRPPPPLLNYGGVEELCVNVHMWMVCLLMTPLELHTRLPPPVPTKIK